MALEVTAAQQEQAAANEARTLAKAETGPVLSVVKLSDDPEHQRLVNTVNSLADQVKNLLSSYNLIEQSSYRIERALFGGWTDTGERSEGFITTMNTRLTSVDEKAGQAIELANESKNTFKSIRTGVWTIVVAAVTSLIPTAVNLWFSLHH